MTTAFNILAFSIVLAEVFAAVGLSTVAPTVFVEMLRALKTGATFAAAETDEILQILLNAMPISGSPAPATTPTPTPTSNNAAQPSDPATTPPKTDRDALVKQLLEQAISQHSSVQLMVPKTATIDAEFACSGSQAEVVAAEAQGVFKVVGVKAGFSSLFEIKSSTNIKLHVEFGVVEYAI